MIFSIVREKHAVIHALLDVTLLGYDAIQDKNFSALLLMDFRKAFDTDPHKIFLQKLYHCGIRGSAYSLIESYLTNRKQLISIIKIPCENRLILESLKVSY